VKTISDIVERHSLAYLSVQKWLVVIGERPLPPQILAETDPPPSKNAGFQSTFARSASAGTLAKSVKSLK